MNRLRRLAVAVALTAGTVAVSTLPAADTASAASCWTASFQRSGSSWCTGMPLGVRQRVQLRISCLPLSSSSMFGEWKEAQTGTRSSKSIPSTWSACWHVTGVYTDLS